MLQQREVMNVFITFQFTDPKTRKVLKDIAEDVCDDIDDYEMGRLYAEKLKPYMEEKIAVVMQVQSRRGNHSFQSIRGKTGLFIIERV